MGSEHWNYEIEDTAGINSRIQFIEHQLSLLKDDTPSAQNFHQQAHDLSSSLELALLNEDISTIDALILSYGDLPNLLDARQLLKEKIELTHQQQQHIQSQDIEIELSQIGNCDLVELKNLRSRIEKLTNTSLQELQIINFDSKVFSFRSDCCDLFASSLKAKSWINSSILTPSTSDYFKDLINLQSLLFTNQDTLWAFDVIAENFKISFDYHFNGDKDTNRIDKPELFFTYHLNYLDNHLSKINRLFDLSDTELSARFSYNEFIRSSIIPNKYKLLSFLNNLRFNLEKEPENEQDVNLLIHLIYETVKYDTALVSKYYYDPEYNGDWTGLVKNFNYEDFHNLLNLEVKLNLKRFNQILNSPDCFQIDCTSALLNELKPTVSSLKLKYLFENLNKSFSRFFHTNYLNHSSLQKFKLKLFSKVYLNILQLYYSRLDDGLSAFSELFNKSKNLISTSSDEIDITGVKGLERLFRIYNSLKYISNSLNYWNQEFIFIELNELFNQLSPTKSISLFDAILLDYNSLIKKTIKLITEFQSRLVKSYLQKYTNKSWFLQPSPSSSQQTTESIELIPLLKSVHEINQFQEKVLSNYEVIQFQNSFSLSLIQQFHQSIIKSNQFNSTGLTQLSFDFNTMMENFPYSKGSRAYRHITEVMVLFERYHEIDVGGLDANQYAKLGDYEGLRKTLGLQWVSNADILDTLLRIKD